MISNQILQTTVDGLKEISRVDLCVIDAEGKVVAKTFDGDVEFYDKLSKVIDKLDDNKFCRVHKSFVINSIYVDVFKSDKVIMCDSAWIPISKSYKKSFREWLVKHNA